MVKKPQAPRNLDELVALVRARYPEMSPQFQIAARHLIDHPEQAPVESMRRIAAAAGMSAAGLYKHFPCKEEMFSALVEPAFQGLMALYRQEETAEREALEAGIVTEKWQSGGEARLAMTYIYDHLDAFRLLICKSQGTRYETFLHDLAVEEEFYRQKYCGCIFSERDRYMKRKKKKDV